MNRVGFKAFLSALALLLLFSTRSLSPELAPVARAGGQRRLSRDGVAGSVESIREHRLEGEAPGPRHVDANHLGQPYLRYVPNWLRNRGGTLGPARRSGSERRRAGDFCLTVFWA